MSELLALLEAERANSRARTAITEEAPLKMGVPKVSGPDEMKAIILEIVGAYMPDEETIAKMRGSGWKSPTGKNPAPANSWAKRGTIDCHRWVMDDSLRFPVDGVVNHAHVPTFKAMVHMGLQKSNLGSGVSLITRNRPNGDWVPVEVEVVVQRKRSLDGLRTLPAWNRLPEGGERYTEIDAPTEAVEILANEMIAVIRWADAKNAPELQVDQNGNPITNITVETQGGGTDPALAKALDRLSERLAPAPAAVVAQEPDAADMKARIAELEAQLTTLGAPIARNPKK